MPVSASIHPECPRCGSQVADDAPEGLCVRCLAKLNFTADSDLTGAEAPRLEPLSLEELAPHFPQLDILSCLGRGGMGVVYKARQKSLDRLVALKILAPEREKDPQFAERFAREALALARLNHPHIVTVHDFGQTDGLFYLLMEFVDGVNLRQLLRDHRLDSKEALAIVPPICDALQYAHDNAVVHRDIKPENLLLDKLGRVKIADFGIARMMEGDTTPIEEQRAGTPRYMAPEQHATPQAADHRADIYSLGVVLYEMLTGELPASQIELPSRKIQIDVRLDEIVLRALKNEPELRFQQAGQMKTAVETLTKAGQEIVPDSAQSAPEAIRSRFPSFRGILARNIKVSIAMLLMVLLLAIGLGFVSMRRNDAWSDSASASSSEFAEFASHGLAAFERGHYDSAIIDWDKAIQLNPNDSKIHRWRGDASLNLHEFDKALFEYDEAIQLDPQNAMAYLCRGAALTEKRDFKPAIAAFDEAIRIDPSIAYQPFYKRYRSAAETLRSSSGGNAEFAQVARHGLDAFQKRDYDQAIVDFDRLIQLDPNHSEAHRWRGDASLNKYEWDRSLFEYDEAIQIDPKNAMAFNGRGAALTGKRQFDQAMAAFDEAARLDPEIAATPFYKRHRAVAENPSSLGVVLFVVLASMVTVALCLAIAFAVWLRANQGKLNLDPDF